MKGTKICAVLVWLFCISFGSQMAHFSQARAETCNRVVAIVNKDLVTLYELTNKIKEMTGFEPSELRLQDEKKYLEARRHILDLLIDEKLTMGKIQELGIQVTEKQVDETIERIKRNRSLTHEDLLAGLKKKGMEYKAYRKMIKAQVEKVRLINFEIKSKIIVREEDIKAYYEKHRQDFTGKGRVHLAIILLRGEKSGGSADDSLRQKAKEIVTRLQNGEDFSELARKFSQGPGAKDGGDMGYFKITQLDPELRQVIGDMSAGEVSGPIERKSVIQIIKLVDKEETGVRSFDRVKDAIYQILYQEEVDKRYSTWIKELRESAYTKIIF
jgi:peptidyl-prolyl cis-trans isomerase SurA